MASEQEDYKEGGRAIQQATVLMARVAQDQVVMVPSRMVPAQLYRRAGCIVRIHVDQSKLIPIPEPPIRCAVCKAHQHTRSEIHDCPAKEGQRKHRIFTKGYQNYFGTDFATRRYQL